MNAAFTQKNRKIAIENNPLGNDALLLTGFTGIEKLSGLFNFQLEMLSEENDIASKNIIGKKITFRISQSEDKTRYFNGYVSRFVSSSMTVQGMRLYRAEIVPWLWFLTCTADCRIFQNQTVLQIIEQVFSEHPDIKDYEISEVKGLHPKREYCVQYRETDFNFVSRLMEEEGIFYWFRHEENRHVLVLADHRGAYKDLPDKEVEYVGGTSETLAQAQLHSWEHRHEFRPGKWVQTDYNFKTPSTKLHTSTQTIVDLSDMKKYEIFDYPGRYGVREDGDQLTKLRMEETEVSCDQVNAAGTYCSFTPGGKFTLKRHECPSEEGKSYLVTSVQHSAEDQTYFGGGNSSQRYSNNFTCIPAEVIFRPSCDTQKTFVHGPQTAMVVGPGGEEIHTDEFGRVKVQFHWDRYGTMDENSSCFIRVSHPSAGKGWGAVSIPRIGQEVIVDFIEGDPDQPIITGRVYNAESMAPYAGGVVSGIKSNTHKGKGYNEMSMDDTAGKEKITIHGQYNMGTTVGNDQSNKIGNNRTTEVAVDDTQSVGSNRKVDIGSNLNESITSNLTSFVGSNQSKTIGGKQSELIAASSTISVGGKRMETVGGGHTFNNPKMAMNVGGKYKVNAGGSITESSPKVSMQAGSKFSATSGGPVNVKAGSVIKQQSGGNFNVKSGGAIKEQSSGVFNIKAGGALKQQGANINLKGPTKVAGKTKITSETKIKGNTLVVS